MADFREYAGITMGDYLAHHGILGMRWGKRNGPPYPLDASDHSASEKKAGWRKSLDGGSPSKEKRSSEKKSDGKSLKDKVSERFSKEGRLQRYKDRALKNIDRRYDRRIRFLEDASIAQKEYSTQKEAKKPNSERLKKKDARIENEIDFEVEALKVMKSKEIEAVMNLDYKGMKSERAAVLVSAGKNWLRHQFAAGVGSMVLGPVGATIGNIYAYRHRNRLRDAKAAYRLNGNTKRYHEQRYKDRLYKETRGGRYKYDKEEYAAKKSERDKKYSYALDKGKVSRIKALYRSGYTQEEVAKKLGISPSSVSRVVNA